MLNVRLIAEGSQSTLEPAGLGAERIANLTGWMLVGAGLVWLIVAGLGVYAVLVPSRHDRAFTKSLVIGGGAIFPTVVLAVLLSFGLGMIPELQRPPPEGSLTIEVSGASWWWRVRYRRPDQGGNDNIVATANEIRLPVNKPVEFKLSSEDVIHSFWIPSLGGKVDMIPGRETRLKLHPTKTGVYRGVCAEYCGTAHAQMNFTVVVVKEDEFGRWLTNQEKPANVPATESAILGSKLFLQKGCGACHAIRGTDAKGRTGPDLTHFGGRRMLGAGVARNDAANLRKWITRTHVFKPGVKMPAFRAVRASELEAIIAYLEQLK